MKNLFITLALTLVTTFIFAQSLERLPSGNIAIKDAKGSVLSVVSKETKSGKIRIDGERYLINVSDAKVSLQKKRKKEWITIMLFKPK